MNSDGGVNVSDVITMINYVFAGGYAPITGTADTNGDGATDISNAVYLINYIFGSGPIPRCS